MPQVPRQKCWVRRARCSAFVKDLTCTIWTGAFEKKRLAIMAFKTLQTRTEPVTLEAMAERLAARKAELGEIEIPRNSGARRTASKRALLAEIEKLGGDW